MNFQANPDTVGKDILGNPIIGRTWRKAHLVGEGELKVRTTIVKP